MSTFPILVTSAIVIISNPFSVLGSRVIVGTNWISNYMCTSTSQESFFGYQAPLVGG